MPKGWRACSVKHLFERADSPSILKTLTLVAALFMLLPLPFVQYIGEEGLMAIKSFEMHARGDWLHPSIYGALWPHSPFWHWPVIAISMLIGWEHVDMAIRLASVLSSWLAACFVGWAASWLWPQHRNIGWLAALVYLSMGEVSFWYGWLGYVDAMFGSFILAAIVLLWRAIHDQRGGWFLASLMAISLAFLTKNITAYALYGLAGGVFLWRYRCWRVILRPSWLLPGLLALCLPMAWQMLVVPSGENTAITTFRDAMRNFAGYGVLDYVFHWLGYPFVFAFRAMPVSLFLIWLVWRRKWVPFRDERLVTLAAVLLACFLPFWISAGATPRYLVPLYGFAALLLARMLRQLPEERIKQGILLMGLVLLLKVPYSLLALPYVKDWRPGHDQQAVAREILALTADAPLRTLNDVATGLAVIAYIDVWRGDRPFVRWFRPKRDKRVYVLAERPTPSLGRLVRSWTVRGDDMYLYYHDAALAREGGRQ
ncbi:MAG: hypothetical protein D6703_01970 [Zetaproteobacteria bacterium]|nr:MAG: hypothetical protein D6703_01970 [Zetaproteobacteria bacterium]